MQNNSWNNSNQYYGSGGGRQHHRSGGRLNNSNSNGQWQGHGQRRNNHHGGGGDGHQGQDSFNKFKDPQPHSKQNKRQAPNRSSGGGLRRNAGYNGAYRERRGARQGSHGNTGRPGTLFFYDTKGNNNPSDDQAIAHSPLAEVEAPKTILGLPPTPLEPQINLPPPNQDLPLDKPADAKPAPPLIKVKQEKKDLPVKKSVEKAKESSSEESSSSESDESVEPGEVKTTSTPKAVIKATAKDVSSPSSSSSSESETEDTTEVPVKSKNSSKNHSLIKSSVKKLKGFPSEDDVVFMGQEKRHYTIPDEDDDGEEDAHETDGSKKIFGKRKSKDKSVDVCKICDKKGHTSFQCQMMCRNCSAPYHSFKNCPNPPNLNVMLQLFMEFNMQQLTMFNIEQRFNLPSTTTIPATPPTKSKKEKKSSKKDKKIPKKKLKLEQNDDNTDESSNDDDALAKATDDSDEEEESSESSDEPQPTPTIKQKRKRTLKQSVAPPGNWPTQQQALPFPMLSPGAPYNSMMYPYGAVFGYPK